ncbi:MAG TPA: hypothetical protein VJB06_02645 [archaeon]|nr:hypothetical protein [archaeon]
MSSPLAWSAIRLNVFVSEQMHTVSYKNKWKVSKPDIQEKENNCANSKK